MDPDIETTVLEKEMNVQYIFRGRVSASSAIQELGGSTLLLPLVGANSSGYNGISFPFRWVP